MAIAHDLGVLDVADAIEQVEQVAFRRVERQVADVKPGRSDFDRLRFPLRPGLLLLLRLLVLRPLMLMRAVTSRSRGFRGAVSKERPKKPLPEGCFFRGSRRCGMLLPLATIATPTSGPAARTARTSPGMVRVHFDFLWLPNRSLDGASRHARHSPGRAGLERPIRADPHCQPRHRGKAPSETPSRQIGEMLVSKRERC